MNTVTSGDGTRIAYESLGNGPPLIVVDGALCHRGMGPARALARRLASHFAVTVYDRRGRGQSGDTLPWSLEHEVEDLGALITAVGGSANVFGVSSGAVLALEAAARGLPVTRLVMYEPPFVVDDTRAPVADDFVPGLHRLLAEGKRDEVVKRFMRMVGVPEFFVQLMRFMPSWRRLTAVAHTVPHDLTIMGRTQAGKPLPTDRWSGLRTPYLVLDGGKSPAWMRHGCQAMAGLFPQSSYRTLPGQTHMVKADAVAPALIEFLASALPRRAA